VNNIKMELRLGVKYEVDSFDSGQGVIVCCDPLGSVKG
jgi:hypothetical protein